MTSPIIRGIIEEMNEQLTLERVLAMSVGLAVAIHDDDEDVPDDAQLFSGAVIGDLREYGDFWNNPMYVCAIVAALLESETQRIANPILAAWPAATAEDRDEIVESTDALQMEVMNRLADVCRTMWETPTIKRQADQSEDGFWSFFTSRY